MQSVNIIEQQQEKATDRSSSFSGDEKHTDDEKASFSEREAKQAADGIAFEEGERKAELQPAVAKVEALYRVFGKGRGRSSIWILYISIALAAYGLSLDGSVTSSFLPLATSAFKKHAALGAITTAEGIIAAVGKPFIARISDVTSRPTAYVISLTCYLLGYILITTATQIAGLATGTLFITVGNAGLDVVTDILVADLCPLQWRGFLTSMVAAPYIINGFVGAEIVSVILAGPGWRWGYGIFCFIMPAVLSPCIVILYWAAYKAKKMDVISFAASPAERRRLAMEAPGEKPSWWSLVWAFSVAMDLGGLSILAVAFSLILLPFTLYKAQGDGWGSGGMIAMLVLGFIFLIGFVLWEWKVASSPIMPGRILRNRAFIGAVTIDVFYFASGNLRATYLSSFVWITQNFSTRDYALFNNTLTVGLCVFGLMAGLIQRYTHRYKLLQIVGLCIRTIGLGIMVKTKGGLAGTVTLVWTQILIAIGGACSVVGSRTASQASVPHSDLASVIALLGLWTKLGGSVGSAIASGIWINNHFSLFMPRNLAEELPQLNATQRATIYGSITAITKTYPYGSPVRNSVIVAYGRTTTPMFIAAVCLSFVCIVAGLAMPNTYLGKTHNAVEETALDGTPLSDPKNHDGSLLGEPLEGERKRSVWRRWFGVSLF